MSRTREAALVAAAFGLYLVLALSAARHHSATFDETVYLPAGYGALAAGDFRVNTVHPPLAKMLGAVPLLAMDVRLDRGDPAWIDPHAWKLGHRFLYQWNDARRLLFAGRCAMTALVLLLAAGVYFWARRHLGPAAAVCALVLTVFSPEVLAHGPLVTNDLAVACFFFLTVATVERALDQPGPGRVLLAGAMLGCALLAKHSALLLAAILPALTLVHAYRTPAGAPRRQALGRTAIVLAGAALAAWVVLWAGYRFRFEAASDAATAGTLTWRPGPGAGLVDRTARLAARYELLPEAYAHGLVDLASRSQSRRAFLLGRHSNEGWWYYFPVAFALKTPLALVALLVVAVAGRAVRGRAAVFLWLPAAVFAAFALTTRVNIGYRYLLPLLPFLFVVAGAAAARLWSAGRAPRIAAVALLAWYVVGSVHAHPHHLSYFNELAGGPYGGYRYLADSNLDWGQDLERLRAFLAEKGIGRVRLSYFGTSSPASYGIEHDLLPSVMRPFPEDFRLHVRPGDVVVVSATNLQSVYLPRAFRPLMERFKEAEPLARPTPSLFVYRVDFHWLMRPHLAAEAGWLPQAIESYRECLRLDPDHPQAREHLDTALALAGRREAAADPDGNIGTP